MSQQIITVSITLVVDPNGTTQDFHFSTRGFTSGPADTPANTVFAERIVDAGEYRRELFSGARVAGLSRPSFGSITLTNHDGELDDWMGYGVSGAPVVVRLGTFGAAFPSGFTEVYRAYARTPTVDFKSVTVPLEDRSIILDKPIATEVFSGNEAFVVGSPTKKKPIVVGRPGFVPLVLVDSALSIYFVQSNATDVRFLNGSLLAYDGGIPLTFGGHYATPLEGVTIAPAPGTFRVWADNGTTSPTSPTGPYPNSVGPCYVRLGSPPEFDVRFDALGLYLDGVNNPIRWPTFPDLVRYAGAQDVTANTLAPGSYPANVGSYYLDGDQTFAEILSDSAQATFAAYGFDRLDRFFTFDLEDPDADALEPVVYTFTTDNARGFERRAVPGQEKPVRQVNVSAGRTWPGSVANGATPEVREQFTREPWHTQFTITSDAVLKAHPGAISVDVQVQGKVEATDADKLAWGQKYIQLYGGLRELITLECTEFSAETIGIELGAKVQIRMPRFLCASGRNFRVVTQTINLKSRTVSFGLWGGSIGPSDAVLGGGTGTRLPVGAGQYFLTRIPHPRMYCAIVVQSIALASYKAIPSPKMTCIIEGGSTLVGPSFPDDWTPTGDPYWSNVIFLSYFEGADGFGASTSYDESDYHRSIASTALTFTTSGAIQGSTSLDFDGSNSLQSAEYNVGAEGIIGTQDWTYELVINADALQGVTAPLLVRLEPQFGPDWQAGNAALHAFHLSPNNVGVSFWVYNYSTSAPLLYGTTDLRGNGVIHVAVSRVGNDWYLGVKGAIEDTATWSGSVNSASLRRRIGGSPLGGSTVRGLIDCVRETVGVGRYTGAYNPPWGGSGGGTNNLTPLTTLLDLRFDGTDGATSTVDSSVYAWTVTLAGGAELDTAQKQAGTASLLCNGSGARAVVSGTGSYLQNPGPVLTFYVRPSTVADCVLMTKGDAAGFTFRISVVSGKIQLENNGLGGTATALASGAPSLTAGSWSKVSVRYVQPASVTSTAGSIEVAVDDVVGAVLPWTVGSGNVPNTASLTIGADYDGSDSFTGHIDAVTVTTA